MMKWKVSVSVAQVLRNGFGDTKIVTDTFSDFADTLADVPVVLKNVIQRTTEQEYTVVDILITQYYGETIVV